MSPVKKPHDRPTTTRSSAFYSLKLSYRGVQPETFAPNLKNVPGNISIYFTIDKLRNQLGSQKTAVPRGLRSHFVYGITFPSCGEIYVGQTTQHLGA